MRDEVVRLVNNKTQRMRLRIDVWLLSLLYDKASRIVEAYDDLSSKLAECETLPPGTRIHITCNKECDNGKGSNTIWIIQRFNSDDNDYYVTMIRKEENNQFKKHWTCVRKECFEVV